MPDGPFDGFLNDYFAECDEHIVNARAALLALESVVGDAAAERTAIDDLFRYFHSLKGISAMVELRPAEMLAHHLEHYLRAIRQREIAVTVAGIDVVMEGIQRLETVINAHRVHAPQVEIDDVIARVSAITATAETPRDAGSLVPQPAEREEEARLELWNCTFVPSGDLMARGIGVDAVRTRLLRIGKITDAIPRVGADGTVAFHFTVEVTRTTPESEEIAAQIAELRADGVAIDRSEAAASDRSDVQDGDSTPPGASGSGDTSATGGGGASPSHVVRVDLTRLDELMQNVGDLVVSRARLVDTLARIEPHVPPSEYRAVQENSVAIDRQLRRLRNGLMRVRLVPVGEIFRRMPFVVRDLARETGRRVNIELAGQSTEIDKYLIERMMDPVIHLVRNAVSHGIEPADQRIAKGKRPDGTITLNASTVGDTVMIEIADDGRGIDAGAVVARARAAGISAPDTSDVQALLAVICTPGFSTTEAADRASGRGVGMSVVKQTVEALSGSLSVESTPDVGTRFIIGLPLTLAITQALIGRVGDESFAVPQSAVREVVDIAVSDIAALEEHEVVSHRGIALPIVRLARLFGIPERPRDRFHVFVIGTGTAALGLAVDRVVGHREIVVRAIADPLVKVEGVSGATDLGDGRVVLILDPAMLTRVTRNNGVGASGRSQALRAGSQEMRRSRA
jgi:two-component system chemotaxis sensor kinase CheA